MLKDAKYTLVKVLVCYALTAVFIVIFHAMFMYDATLPLVWYARGYYDHPASTQWVEFLFGTAFAMALAMMMLAAHFILKFLKSRREAASKELEIKVIGNVIGIPLIIVAPFLMQLDVRGLFGGVYLFVGTFILLLMYYVDRKIKREKQ